MCEIWKNIPTYPDYDVSNMGKIRSWKKYNGTPVPRIIKQRFDRYGYPVVGIFKEKKFYSKTVHKLSLEAFIGPPPKGMISCHNDGNKKNNLLSNLRWDTYKSNTADIKKHGTSNPPIGERCSMAKLKENDIYDIFWLDSQELSQTDIAKQYKMSPSSISRILSGDNWSHIKNPFYHRNRLL